MSSKYVDKEGKIEFILDRINEYLGDADDEEWEFDNAKDRVQCAADDLMSAAGSTITDGLTMYYTSNADVSDELNEMESSKSKFSYSISLIVCEVNKLKKLAPKDWKHRIKNADLDLGSTAWKVVRTKIKF